MRIVLPSFKLYLFLTCCSVLIFLFDQINFLDLPKSLLQQVAIPIEYGMSKSGRTVVKQFEFIWLARSASNENSALKKQLGELLLENADLRKKLSEYGTLVDQASSLNPKTYNLLGAKVIGQGRYLLIDRGTEDGVTKDQIVVYKNNYVGQVKNISAHTSQIMLAEDPDSKIAVFSQNVDGKAKGLLVGQFGSKLLMDKILHQEKISEGDLVYSEGTEGSLPRGLVMGVVSFVDERQNEVFKQAEVRPVFDKKDLDMVFIVRI